MAGVTATVLAGLAAASSVVGGLQQNKAAKEQASFAEAQGILQSEENVRVSAAQAQQEAEASADAQRRQKLAYLKSGVTLDGTPFAMMEKTRIQGQQNVDEITTAGGYASAAAQQEGRTQASNLKASGRQALISGIGRGAQTAGGLF